MVEPAFFQVTDARQDTQFIAGCVVVRHFFDWPGRNA
jgi:hypothetical protein